MFWTLFFAHLLADYPLQPMWLVRSKDKIWALVLHAGIHFLTMLLLVGETRQSIWPQLLILATFHFIVDVVKYRLSDARPEWITVPYFVDQAVHIGSILVVATWIDLQVPEAALAVDPIFFIFASGYLLATHVWFVTEKTISHANAGYLDEVETTLWPRMVARAAFLTVLLLVLVNPDTGTGAFVALAAALQLPYYKDAFWRRALTADIVVASLVTILVLVGTNLVQQ